MVYTYVEKDLAFLFLILIFFLLNNLEDPEMPALK